MKELTQPEKLARHIIEQYLDGREVKAVLDSYKMSIDILSKLNNVGLTVNKRALDKDILLCMDAIESKGPGCPEWQILKALVAGAEDLSLDDAALARENHWRNLEGRDLATPKPAPDAVREALRARAAAYRQNGGRLFSGYTIADELAEIYLAAHVPSPDGSEHRWLNDLIKAAEAFRVAVIFSRALDKIPQDQFIDQLRALETALNPFNYRASATGAAEPVAWRHTIVEPGDQTPAVLLSHSQNNPWAHWTTDHLNGCKYTCAPLYATPPVRGDRETIAVPAVAPEGCPCCGGKMYLNGANYSCDKNTSMSFHTDDLSLPVQPGAGELAALCDFLETRAAGFQERGTSIFSGATLAEELRETAHMLRSRQASQSTSDKSG